MSGTSGSSMSHPSATHRSQMRIADAAPRSRARRRSACRTCRRRARDCLAEGCLRHPGVQLAMDAPPLDLEVGAAFVEFELVPRRRRCRSRPFMRRRAPSGSLSDTS